MLGSWSHSLANFLTLCLGQSLIDDAVILVRFLLSRNDAHAGAAVYNSRVTTLPSLSSCCRHINDTSYHDVHCTGKLTVICLRFTDAVSEDVSGGRLMVVSTPYKDEVKRRETLSQQANDRRHRSRVWCCLHHQQSHYVIVLHIHISCINTQRQCRPTLSDGDVCPH